MGIANTFTFGGVSTSDYGLVVEGSGDYSAPKRATETINIPGRNGAFQLDKGYYENIEIEYKVVVADATQADFNDAIEAFRNAIVSQIGYQRLEDTYHPGEYRMATYNGGLNDAPTFHGKGAIFKIKFNCKPQRWLTSGETAVTVTSGGTLTNPTLFESGPLLEATGSGAIEFNGYEIEFAGVPYGEVVIGDKATWILGEIPLTVTLDTSLLNVGDSIYPEARECVIRTRLEKEYGVFIYEGITSSTNVLDAYGIVENNVSLKKFWPHLIPDFGDGFVYGTAKTITCSATFNYQSGYPLSYWQETVQATIAYDGADSYTVTVQSSGNKSSSVNRTEAVYAAPTMYGNSSQIITDPISIDCDLGEAYIVDGGVYRSLNQYIDLGSELPKLGVGENEITFDNTITELKVQPRWWKV